MKAWRTIASMGISVVVLGAASVAAPPARAWDATAVPTASVCVYVGNGFLISWGADVTGTAYRKPTSWTIFEALSGVEFGKGHINPGTAARDHTTVTARGFTGIGTPTLRLANKNGQSNTVFCTPV